MISGQHAVCLYINNQFCKQRKYWGYTICLNLVHLILRKQLGAKNSKSNAGRREKNGGVKGRDGSVEELDRETGEEQTTVGRTRRKDGG